MLLISQEVGSIHNQLNGVQTMEGFKVLVFRAFETVAFTSCLCTIFGVIHLFE